MYNILMSSKLANPYTKDSLTKLYPRSNYINNPKLANPYTQESLNKNFKPGKVKPQPKVAPPSKPPKVTKRSSIKVTNPKLGVGISKSGYSGARPVALPGLTTKASGARPSGIVSKGIPSGIKGALKSGAATAGVYAANYASDYITQLLKQNRGPMKEEDQDFWNIVDTLGDVGSTVGSFIHPAAGVVMKPIMELFGQAANQTVENERKAIREEAAGGCTDPSSVRFLECMAYREKLNEDAKKEAENPTVTEEEPAPPPPAPAVEEEDEEVQCRYVRADDPILRGTAPTNPPVGASTPAPGGVVGRS